VPLRFGAHGGVGDLDAGLQEPGRTRRSDDALERTRDFARARRSRAVAAWVEPAAGSPSRTSPKNRRWMSAARGKGDGGDIGSGSFMEDGRP
jgi:hypothetical protein